MTEVERDVLDFLLKAELSRCRSSPSAGSLFESHRRVRLRVSVIRPCRRSLSSRSGRTRPSNTGLVIRCFDLEESCIRIVALRSRRLAWGSRTRYVRSWTNGVHLSATRAVWSGAADAL